MAEFFLILFALIITYGVLEIDRQDDLLEQKVDAYLLENPAQSKKINDKCNNLLNPKECVKNAVLQILGEE